MALKSAIELTSGVGRRWRRAGAALWLLACFLLFALTVSGRVPAAWLLAGWAVLAIELPAVLPRRRAASRVRLYHDGSLTSAGAAGSWSPASWSTRWLSVVPADIGGRRVRVVVAAWRNDADAYRVLRTWLRHPPQREPARPPGPAP